MAEMLSVTLSGDLEVSRSSSNTSTSDDCLAFKLDLATATRSGDVEISQKLASVDSAGAFVALPFPANLQGKLLFLRVLTNDSLDVQVTHNTQGTTVYPVRHLLVIEPSEDEYITLVEVQGVGDFEWIVVGDEP